MAYRITDLLKETEHLSSQVQDLEEKAWLQREVSSLRRTLGHLGRLSGAASLRQPRGPQQEEEAREGLWEGKHDSWEDSYPSAPWQATRNKAASPPTHPGELVGRCSS